MKVALLLQSPQLMLIEPIIVALKVCHLFENARRFFDNVSVYH